MTGAARPSLSVVLPTHGRPDALEAVLWALSEQTDSDFDVVVAADGEEDELAAVAGRWRDRAFGARLVHVSQERAGFRLARARNLGALAARGEYLVFLDADCVPRRRFAAALRRAAVPGWFVGLRRARLGEGFTQQVLQRRLAVHRWPTLRLLRHAGRERPRAWRGVDGWRALVSPNRQRPWRPELPDFVPYYGGWGFGLGVFRADLERVNGWDARFAAWGAEDEDLALRLHRVGLRSSWPGPASSVLHLWHPTRRADTRTNRVLLEETEATGRVEAVLGLRELAAEPGVSEAGAEPLRAPARLGASRLGDDADGDRQHDRQP